MARTVLGYVNGQSGQFGRLPFFALRLSLDQAAALDGLLGRAGAQSRNTTTLTASFHQPARLRVTEIEPPDYELRAAAQYVRGDVVRVQGKEGVSCGLDVSARFGIPLLREQLSAARGRARDFLELRVPSRKRDLVEFVPDVDLTTTSDEAAALAAAQVAGLEAEDFSDWEAAS